ncbi:hypothetical protein K458DRAFT_403093 [Lentithecium fluviatile CBS 122367]|uniref:Uncharacterized protein n=1 Tax=Lentithecium fluviatile CBS 122367 TaxID=1168545 RepID=A0A6G1J699_9PLEO|nr:hypothetical protein K458DRAFT_403093 [Lentithecium fluviatile CBS 122367]
MRRRGGKARLSLPRTTADLSQACGGHAIAKATTTARAQNTLAINSILFANIPWIIPRRPVGICIDIGVDVVLYPCPHHSTTGATCAILVMGFSRWGGQPQIGACKIPVATSSISSDATSLPHLCRRPLARSTPADVCCLLKATWLQFTGNPTENTSIAPILTLWAIATLRL